MSVLQPDGSPVVVPHPSTPVPDDKALLIGVVKAVNGVYPPRPNGYALIRWEGPTSPPDAQPGDEWVL